MSSREITLWLDERWYQALTQQLEVKKLEDMTPPTQPTM